MAPHASTDKPDATLWRDDDQAWCYACSHCPMMRHFPGRSQAHAMEQASSHLWSTHSLRRTWLVHLDPAYRDAVQTALPFVIEAKVRSDRRDWTG